MTQLIIRLLGAPGIERDAAPVTVDTRKAIALLAYLAVSGRGQTREALAALLWPDYDDQHARAALRRTLSALRAALDEPHLAVDRETVALIPGAGLWLDVAEFHARLAACRTHGHAAADVCPACLTPLAEAAALYRDDFLAGFSLRDSADFDDWQRLQAENLRGELATALEKLAHGYGAQGDFAAALDAARRWLTLDPMREEAHRQAMRLYAWIGQRNAALHQYRDCVRILEQELGVAPLAETTELYEAIKGNRLLAQPPDLWGLQESARPQPPPAPRPLGFAEIRKTATSIPLVGRAREWDTLRRAYEQRAARGFFLALEGEAGIGKTRLAEEFLAWARDLGATTIAMRCYEGEANVPYGPVADGLRGVLAQKTCADQLGQVPAHWLTEVARLLPELHTLRPDLPLSPALDAPGAQSRFLEGLRQALATFCRRSAPTILFFDDVHWADAASLDLLAYLVRRVRDQPLFILAAWRDGEALATQPRLRSLVTAAQRTGNGAEVALQRLTLADVFELTRVLAAGGADLPNEIGGQIYDETEGLPFFLAAYLDALLAGKNGAWTILQSVRDLLYTRLHSASPAGQQMLQAAAVLGRSFDLETVQAISGRSEEETITTLEALVAQRLLTEAAGDARLAGPAYDFNHEKLRTLAYEETSLARRRLLHGRAAHALVERGRRRREGDLAAGQIAQHFHLAGQDAEAARFFVLAGEQARRLYANAEALAHFRTALALGHPDAASLHAAIGDLQTLLGEYGAALVSLETAAALHSADQAALAAIEHKLANLHGRRGDWAAAESHFEAAILDLGAAGDRSELARIYADWSLVAHQKGEADRAAALAQAALTVAESAGDQRDVAQAHNILGILARARNDFGQAVHHLQISLTAADQLGDAAMRVAALNNLALAHRASDDLAGALTLTNAALALCRKLGDRHREAALHTNLADLLHAAGQDEEMMAHLKQAVVIFAEIGVQAGDAQPEIWKLTEW